IPPSKLLTGPDSSRRLVCAPGLMAHTSYGRPILVGDRNPSKWIAKMGPRAAFFGLLLLGWHRGPFLRLLSPLMTQASPQASFGTPATPSRWPVRLCRQASASLAWHRPGGWSARPGG